MNLANSTTADRQSLIALAYDPQLVEQAGHRLVEMLSEHLRVVESGQGPVLNWAEPARNIELAKSRLQQADASPDSATRQDVDAITARFEELVRESLSRGQNLHHPHYVGHQVPASLPLAALFTAIDTLTNQVMAIYEMGPWATAVERAVVETLGEAVGFAPGTFGGLVTSGGSLANLTALLTARNVSLKKSWSRGLAARQGSSGDGKAPVLVAHADAHYSVTRAAGILGLGAEQVVRVPLDTARRMDVGRLDAILARLRASGVPIIAVSAAACATPTGAFDLLADVADVCRRHDVWLHVDAAHGGAACLSNKYRHLVAGLELADSVVCDAHKMLFIPALCALVFYRNKDHRFATFQQDAPYLFDPSAEAMAEYDSGIVNLECTKRAAALGLWGVWSLFGQELFAALIDETFDMGHWFHELLSEQTDFEPYCRPQCNIVVFRHLPAALRDQPPKVVDDFQSRLRQSVIRSGDFYLVSSVIDGRNYLRTTIINPLTGKEHLQGLLACLREHGRALIGP